MQSSSFGLQSDGAFQGRVRSCYWLQEVFLGKVAGLSELNCEALEKWPQRGLPGAGSTAAAVPSSSCHFATWSRGASALRHFTRSAEARPATRYGPHGRLQAGSDGYPHSTSPSVLSNGETARGRRRS